MLSVPTPFLPSPYPSPPRKLRSAMAYARRGGAVERAASFGRWWFDTETAQIVLSARAAEFLEVEAGLHRHLENCLIQVLPDDVLMLMTALTQAQEAPVDCEFRIVNALNGLRWIQMQSLPPGAAQRSVRTGVLTDITSSKHAALRARFNFESTQILIGTSTLQTAVTKVIQLVCENLGWDWGAYWAVDPESGDSPKLTCRQFWHAPHFQLTAFTRDSGATRMEPGEGLVGQVWGTGEAGWVEDFANHPNFLRSKSASECGLRSGYAFPVAYISADGERRSPGVLEFFSTLARQREAQLPNLSMAIGTLIAQTDERYKQQERTAAMEESLRRSHRALRVIHDCERVIASSRDERTLLQGVCDVVAVGYRMAWVAVLGGDGGAGLRLAGITGAHQDYLDCLGPSLAAAAAGNGTIGAALRSHAPVAVNDFERDARLAPWWTDAAQRGFRAKVALPLVRHDDVLGILNIYSVEHDAFDPEEVALLQSLADRVTATVQSYRYREARHAAQAALRQRERALEYQVHYDALTGLPNRVLLHQRLSQAIADPSCPVWLVYLDLDRFKVVNDSLGHKAGDQLLKQVAGRLRAAVNPTDTVARLGGDEYVLILSDPDALPGILHAVAQPLVIEGHEFFPSCSMGVAAWPADGKDEATLMRHADIAMYQAKELGRNNYQFYSCAMNARSLERLHLEGELRHALERDEFVLHYQPQIALRSGRIVGMEALIRWNHPELGMVPPDQFIGLAEETGLIVAIGDWVLRSACAQTKAWQRAGHTGLRVSVNLSARQFGAQDLAPSIMAVLAETGLAADCLDIELTESSLMADVDAAVASMHALKAIGVQLSIDDFGTGYSSLAYLKRFPIDVLKIDKSFVRDVISAPDDAAIVASIISLAHNLKLHVIAEGVETAEQLAFLRRHGCDDMQGYWFSKPVAAAAFEQMLAAARKGCHVE